MTGHRAYWTTDYDGYDEAKEFWKGWHEIREARESRNREFAETLKSAGIKGMHYNNGWVDRQNRKIQYVKQYSEQFNYVEKVGDLFCLGDASEFTIVKIIKIDLRWSGLKYYYYDYYYPDDSLIANLRPFIVSYDGKPIKPKSEYSIFDKFIYWISGIKEN